MEIKTVTIRIPGSTYEKLCKLASENEELPSETARQILRKTLTVAKEDSGNEVIIAEVIPKDDKVIIAEVIPEDDKVIIAEVIPEDDKVIIAEVIPEDDD